MPATASITDDALDRGRHDDEAAAAGGVAHRASRWLRRAPTPLLCLALVLFAVGHVLGYPDRTSEDLLFNSPHENARYELAERWLDTGSPTYPLPAHDRLPADVAPALTPRDAGLLDGAVVPKDFVYGLALVAGLRAVSPWLPVLLSTISAVALLVVTGLLGRHVLGSRAAGVLAAGLLASTIPFWSAAAGLVETGATTAALFLAGVLALVVRRGQVVGSGGAAGGLLPDVLAGVCFGLAVGTHYATVLLAAGTALAFARRRDGGSAVRLAALVVAAGITLAPVLAFNADVYGSALTDGYSVGVDFLDENLGENTGGLLTLRPGPLLEHVQRYLLRTEALAFLGLAALGAWAAHRGGRRTALPALGAAALLGGIPLLVFAGARPLSGVDTFLVNASLMRYLAPLAGLLAVLAAAGATELARHGRAAATVVVGSTLLLGIGVAVDGPQGPLDTRDRIPRDRAQRDLALEVIPPEAVVITGRSDKFLWPRRTTLSAPYLVDEPIEAGDDGHLARRAPSPQRLGEVVVGVADAGFEVFLWNEGRWFNGRRRGAFDELDGLLAAEGIERVETELPGLWRFRAG